MTGAWWNETWTDVVCDDCGRTFHEDDETWMGLACRCPECREAFDRALCPAEHDGRDAE